MAFVWIFFDGDFCTSLGVRAGNVREEQGGAGRSREEQGGGDDDGTI